MVDKCVVCGAELFEFSGLYLCNDECYKMWQEKRCYLCKEKLPENHQGLLVCDSNKCKIVHRLTKSP